MNIKAIILLFFILFVFPPSYATTLTEDNANADINMIESGAKPDGKTDNTNIIQKAIDKCSESGGGVVFFPAGTYMSGSIFLKDNVTLNLHKLAVLKGISKKEVSIEINGAGSDEFVVTRSGESEKYKNVGTFPVEDGKLTYKAPAGSVSTFVAK